MVKIRFAEAVLSRDYNFMADGDPSKYSWVGNFLSVNGDARVLTCPSSSVIAGDTINEMLGRADQSPGNFPPPSQRDGGLFTSLIDPLTGNDRLVASEKRDGVVRNALEKGLYSNYQASWFFVRGELLIDDNGDVQPTGCNGMWSGLRSDPAVGKATCTGPMSHGLGARADIPMSSIPWLSEAGRSSGNSALLRLDPQTYSLDSAGCLIDGAVLYSNKNWGPAYFTSGKLCHLNEGFEGKETFRVENLEVLKYPTINEVPGLDSADLNSVGGPMILQDTRSWRPAHGSRSWVLMGDGSVKTLTDLNGDGYFNPGFSISKDQTDLSYQHGPCEMDTWECYSGALLWKPRTCIIPDKN